MKRLLDWLTPRTPQGALALALLLSDLVFLGACGLVCLVIWLVYPGASP